MILKDVKKEQKIKRGGRILDDFDTKLRFLILHELHFSDFHKLSILVHLRNKNMHSHKMRIMSGFLSPSIHFAYFA